MAEECNAEGRWDLWEMFARRCCPEIIPGEIENAHVRATTAEMPGKAPRTVFALRVRGYRHSTRELHGVDTKRREVQTGYDWFETHGAS